MKKGKKAKKKSFFALLQKKKNFRPRFYYFSISAAILVIILTTFAITHHIFSKKTAEATPVTPLQHIIFMVKENRSFDSYFGTFPGANGTTTYTSSTGATLTLNHQPDSLLNDIHHEPKYAHIAYDNGKMDDFALIKGAIQNGVDEADSQVYQSDIPNYWQYAQHYTLGDNMFSTIMGPSFPNHLFMIGAQDNNVDSNPNNTLTKGIWGCDAPTSTWVEEVASNGAVTRQFPCFDYQTMADELDQNNVSWKYYAPGFGQTGYIWSSYDAINHVRNGADWSSHVVDPSNFITDVNSGNLPQVSWFVQNSNVSDHPPASICQGENYTVNEINAVMNNPAYWNNTAIVLIWDDFGGFYDHVPPPAGPNPQIEYGFRVPVIVISPYAKNGIDHTMYSFPSVLRMIEDNFGLPALGTFDAQSNSLMNAMDFNQTPLPPLPLQQRTCPTPTPTPTISPTPTPTPTQGAVIAQDTFQRANQQFWGTASDGQIWGGGANKQTGFSIVNNTGQIQETISTTINATLGPSTANMEVLVSGSMSVLNASNSIGVAARWTSNTTFYKAMITGKNLIIQKDVNGTTTQLASVAFAATANTSYTIRFNTTGTTLSAKVWQTGTTEPATWMATATDSSISSGQAGLRMVEASGTTATISSFQATQQ